MNVKLITVLYVYKIGNVHNVNKATNYNKTNALQCVQIAKTVYNQKFVQDVIKTTLYLTPYVFNVMLKIVMNVHFIVINVPNVHKVTYMMEIIVNQFVMGNVKIAFLQTIVLNAHMVSNQ